MDKDGDKNISFTKTIEMCFCWEGLPVSVRWVRLFTEGYGKEQENLIFSYDKLEAEIGGNIYISKPYIYTYIYVVYIYTYIHTHALILVVKCI